MLDNRCLIATEPDQIERPNQKPRTRTTAGDASSFVSAAASTAGQLARTDPKP
jgi:hypothetical protein